MPPGFFRPTIFLLENIWALTLEFHSRRMLDFIGQPRGTAGVIRSSGAVVSEHFDSLLSRKSLESSSISSRKIEDEHQVSFRCDKLLTS
jgi:hypothetical protein